MDEGSTNAEKALRSELAECRAELNRLRLLLDVQSTIDLSTGLYNAQGMLEPIQGAMDRLARTGEMFAVMVIDLPGVAVADPAVRDDAMRHAGALVSATVRSLDRVGRLGETTLMLVLPQVGAAGVQVVIERIDRNLGVIPMGREGDSIALDSVFTVLLNPDEPMAPEEILDAVTVARESASLGSPAIVRAGA
jgi:diguanylate cyclase (GGDEF)-like protein